MKAVKSYVVRQGDYLTKLAYVHGFDAADVWKDPKNAELRGKRGDHDILARGDVLFVPMAEKVGVPLQKGVTNRYVARVPAVDLSLVFATTKDRSRTSHSRSRDVLRAIFDRPT